MTQIFKDGVCIPITLIEIGPCTVLQVKTKEKDGYQALQLGFEDKRIKRCTKPEIGHAEKHAKTSPKRYVKEIPWDGTGDIKAGDKITASHIKDLKFVDVIGISKGRGFAGCVKRYHFAGGPKTHGQSDRLRAPGSIGSSASPSRVFKGLKMPGHMGAVRRTVINLKVVEVNENRGTLMVNGGIPGHNGGYVIIKKSPKKKQ